MSHRPDHGRVCQGTIRSVRAAVNGATREPRVMIAVVRLKMYRPVPSLPAADPSELSVHAKRRGAAQQGTTAPQAGCLYSRVRSRVTCHTAGSGECLGRMDEHRRRRNVPCGVRWAFDFPSGGRDRHRPCLDRRIAAKSDVPGRPPAQWDLVRASRERPRPGRALGGDGIGTGMAVTGVFRSGDVPRGQDDHALAPRASEKGKFAVPPSVNQLVTRAAASVPSRIAALLTWILPCG